MRGIWQSVVDRPVPVFWLGICLLISLLIQFHNLSPYKIYPDSYVSLIVAANLRHAGRLAAPLGPGGLVYPSFLAWTRPLYPILIALGSLVAAPITVARAVAVVAGLLGIVAVFSLASRLFRSAGAGLIAAVLLATSYAHGVWGGFILTEPLAVLVVTVAVWRLWSNRQFEGTWLNGRDALTGLLFALALLTRFEYAVLLIPAILWTAHKWQPARAVTVVASALIPAAIITLALRPFSGGLGWVRHQLWPLAPLWLLGIILAFVAMTVLYRLKPTAVIRDRLAKFAVAAIAVLAAGLALNHHLYLGLWQFATHDWLVAGLAPVGLFLMLLRPKTRSLGLFLVTSVTLLGATYYHTNPLMERYLTHLLPFLIPAAAYAAWRGLTSRWRYVAAAALTVAIVLQGVQSYRGLHDRQGGTWFQADYEQAAAVTLSRQTTAQDLIVAALPEPFRLYTGSAAQSVAAQAPYLYLDLSRPNQTVYVIDDQALHDQFPGFTALVETKLAAYRLETLQINAPYHYRTETLTDPKALMVYRLKARQLNCLIANVGCP